MGGGRYAWGGSAVFIFALPSPVIHSVFLQSTEYCILPFYQVDLKLIHRVAFPELFSFTTFIFNEIIISECPTMALLIGKV
jgi:hypothetical protein